MSTRTGKRRGRPPKTPVTDRSSKFQYQLLKKPKYLLNRGSDSQFSTPSASRASSPQNSDDGIASRRTSARARRGRPSAGVTASNSKRGSQAGPSTATTPGRRGELVESGEIVYVVIILICCLPLSLRVRVPLWIRFRRLFG